MRKIKKFAAGGTLPYAQIGQFGADTLDAFTPPDEYNVKSDEAAIGSGALKGAGTGAAIGSVVPVIGTAIGAAAGGIIGGTMGYLGNEEQKGIRTKALFQKDSVQNGINANKLIGYDQTGSNTNQIYAKYGGSIAYEMGGEINPNDKIKIQTQLLKERNSSREFESRNKIPTLKDQLFNIDKSYSLSRFNENLPDYAYRDVDNLPSSQQDRILKKYTDPSNTYRELEEQQNNIPDAIKSNSLYNITRKKFASGGTIKPLSDENIEIEGRTHEEGGVKLSPEVEVEDGETMTDTQSDEPFVFSEELGFAKLHKPIAKTIGKLEKKVLTNTVNNTLKLLNQKQEALKMQQEQYKKILGL